MERTLCVWYPDWPLRRPDAPPDRPAQAVGDDNRVLARNQLAVDAGILHGMRRREAEAVCPDVVTIEADPGGEAARFEPVAQTIESVVPRIEIVMPGLVLVPITGAVAFYGSEGDLVEHFAKELDRINGPGFRVGVADGPFLAQRAAHQATPLDPVVVVDDAASFLSGLDISTLDREEMAETFRWLGITTLGELANIPRAAIVSRFGSEGLRAHRLATGEHGVLSPRALPPDLAVDQTFTPPLDNLEQAAFLARNMAHRLLSEMRGAGAAPHRVEVTAVAADGEERIRVWRNKDPFDEETLTERVKWQLRAWLDTKRHQSGPGIHGGVARLRLEPADISGDGRQLALQEDARTAAESHRALIQTQAIVGDDAVLRVRRQGGRDPVEQVQWYRWGEEPPARERDPEAPWPGRVPSPAPSLVPPEPYPLEVEWDGGIPVRVRLGSRWVPVLSWAGPWRKIGRWWDGEGNSDRYQLVTSAGAFLCEVSEGRTYMTGVYD
jgi:protein ImuB